MSFSELQNQFILVIQARVPGCCGKFYPDLKRRYEDIDDAPEMKTSAIG